MQTHTKKYALISVSDKHNIEHFAKGLVDLGYGILSSSGTRNFLSKHNIDSIDISAYTGFEELFSGRVKTLHPKIFGGILYRRDFSDDVVDKNKLDIFDINVVCVDLYPFERVSKNSNNIDEIVENIDIGGVSLLRAAAKNYKDVFVITDFSDYNLALEKIKNNDNLAHFRIYLAHKAFEKCKEYDSLISNFMKNNVLDSYNENSPILDKQNKKIDSAKSPFEDEITIKAKKICDLNYGENPHQLGALYDFNGFFGKYFKVLKGQISFNNLNDINAALKIATSFKEKSICIIKHANPCGFGINNDILRAYDNAMICDSLSAYGGVIAINDEINKELAQKMITHFFEVIIAPKISTEALKIFESKKRIKLIECSINGKNLAWQNVNLDSNLNDFKNANNFDFKKIENGLLVQSKDEIKDCEVFDAVLKTKNALSANDLENLNIAYKIVGLSKSNAIAFVKNHTLMAIGAGLTSRIDCIKLAIAKAKEFNINLKDTFMASEAFFPFKDSIELAQSVGVKGIIEPGGSIRDDEVIKCANDNNIALYFSNTRHFLH